MHAWFTGCIFIANAEECLSDDVWCWSFDHQAPRAMREKLTERERKPRPRPRSRSRTLCLESGLSRVPLGFPTVEFASGAHPEAEYEGEVFEGAFCHQFAFLGGALLALPDASAAPRGLRRPGLPGRPRGAGVGPLGQYSARHPRQPQPALGREDPAVHRWNPAGCGRAQRGPLPRGCRCQLRYVRGGSRAQERLASLGLGQAEAFRTCLGRELLRRSPVFRPCDLRCTAHSLGFAPHRARLPESSWFAPCCL